MASASAIEIGLNSFITVVRIMDYWLMQSSEFGAKASFLFFFISFDFSHRSVDSH
jgi:hypothetical protein